jgi:hypothetical protein
VDHDIHLLPKGAVKTSTVSKVDGFAHKDFVAKWDLPVGFGIRDPKFLPDVPACSSDPTGKHIHKTKKSSEIFQEWFALAQVREMGIAPGELEILFILLVS